MNSTHHLILASGSPRRQELLRQAGFQFEVFVRDFDESFPADMMSTEVAEFLAVQKNQHYRKLRKTEVIITSDTTVVIGKQVLNKPNDKQEAKAMLDLLSGNTHQVITGVCISSLTKTVSFSESTEVTFSVIEESEIEYYIQNFRPFDKAGSYGIQEWIGLTKIRSIKGSYFNVMGLPTHRVHDVLTKEFKIDLIE